MVDYDKFYREEDDPLNNKNNDIPPSSAEILYTKFFTIFYIILIVCSFPLSIGLCIQVVQVGTLWYEIFPKNCKYTDKTKNQNGLFSTIIL